MDISGIIQQILYALFALLTAAVASITGPTYDNLLVPELSSSSLYPTISPDVSGGPTFVSRAADFSSFLVTNVVDPSIVLIAIGVGGAYLLRSVFPRGFSAVESFLPRLVFAIILANFTLPIAGALLGVGGALYPVVSGFDGGTWQQWVNLAGAGEIQFSWDNGAFAFVLSFVMFSLVILLVLAVALRDALLGVLLVLLPVFTLLWPIPPLAPLARRAWLLFGELVFLPCILVIPLELAVGAPNAPTLVAYLAIALSSPYFLSLAGAQLSGLGFPAAGSTLSSGVQRGLGIASLGAASYARPVADLGSGSQAIAGGLAARTGAAGFPAAAPLVVGEAFGRGVAHLVRHIPHAVRSFQTGGSFPTVARKEE